MPTFTAIALDRLIEPGAARSMALSRDSHDSELDRRNSVPNTRKDMETDSTCSKLDGGVSVPVHSRFGRGVSVPPDAKIEKEAFIPSNKLDRRNSSPPTTSVAEKKHHWTKISPALYATPEPTPIPDSPSSFPPSPYIINHKRRGPRLLKSFSEEDVATREPSTDGTRVDENTNAFEKELATVSKDDSCTPKEVVGPTMDECTKSLSSSGAKENYSNSICHDHGSSDIQNGNEGGLDTVGFYLQQEGEDDVFVDPQDSMSVMSIGESEGTGWEEQALKSSTPIAEFYDAWEELSLESGSNRWMRDVETELRDIRLSLLMEIEKRKQAEETLNNVRNQWQRIRKELSLVGLTLPDDPTILPTGEQPADSAADVCQQIYVARFVSDAIGRGAARAETEKEMETQIKMKNFEITRLWDRLRYYEAVNQEMSQRNQEVVETARRLRQKRQRRQKLVWGSVAAAAISVGSAFLVYSYFKGGKVTSSQSLSHASEIDHKTK